MKTKCAEIQQAIENREINRARFLLRSGLSGSPTAEVYLLAAAVAGDDHQRRDFLEKAIALDPFQRTAYWELQRLAKRSPAKAATGAPVFAQPQNDQVRLNRVAPILTFLLALFTGPLN